MTTTPPAPADRIITRFLRSHANDWGQANRDNATRVLNRAQAFLADRDLSLIHDDVEALIDELGAYLDLRRTTPKADGTPYSDASLLVEHRQLCAFYKWATRDPGDGQPLMARNPMRMIDAPRPAPPDPAAQPVVDDWKYQALMATTQVRRRDRHHWWHVTGRRDAAMIAILWHTGVRRSELCNMDFERLDFERQSIYLPKTKGGRRAPRSRWVYLPDEAMEFLDRYLDDRGSEPGPLFLSVTHAGRRLEPQSVTLILRRRAAQAAAKLGCSAAEVYSPAHSFRRASAIAWLDAGGSETGLMRNHGWSTNAMIDRYTGPRKDELTAAEAKRMAEARKAGRHLSAVPDRKSSRPGVA